MIGPVCDEIASRRSQPYSLETTKRPREQVQVGLMGKQGDSLLFPVLHREASFVGEAQSRLNKRRVGVGLV